MTCPDTADMVLWEREEAGEGRLCTLTHPAQLEDLAQGSAHHLGEAAKAAGRPPCLGR